MRTPHLADPKTGEILNPDDLAQRIIGIVGELESVAELLATRTEQLAMVSSRYGRVFNLAVAGSAGRAKDTREADAFQAVYTQQMDGDHMSLAERRTHLEAEVRMLRERAHDLRSRMSGLQTASRAIGIVFSAGVGT